MKNRNYELIFKQIDKSIYFVHLIIQTYISILRGINVSGHKRILMTELKVLYEELGFTDVKTYIQSGNVIFRTKDNKEEVIVKIERAIKKKFGFYVPVIIRTISEFKKVILSNPFPEDSDINKIAIVFLEKVPLQNYVEKVIEMDFLPDKFVIKERDIFILCVNGFGRTKLTNNFFENKLKVKATTRNWKTVNKLIELSKLLK